MSKKLKDAQSIKRNPRTKTVWTFVRIVPACVSIHHFASCLILLETSNWFWQLLKWLQGRFSMSPLICENFGGSDELWVVACSDQSTSNCHAVLHHWHSPLNLLLHTWNSGSIKSTVSTQSALSLHSDFCKTQQNKNDEKRIVTRQSFKNKILWNSGISKWVEFFCMG